MAHPLGIYKGLKVSKAQLRVLELYCSGVHMKAIGQQLGISEHTANNHLHKARVKNNCINNAQLAVKAMEHGITLKSNV